MLEQPVTVNWAGFIFSSFMAQQYDTTLQAIEALFNVLKEDEKEADDPVKRSELFLFHAHVLHT